MMIIKTRNEVGGNNRQFNCSWSRESHFKLFHICDRTESIVLLKYKKRTSWEIIYVPNKDKWNTMKSIIVLSERWSCTLKESSLR